tara:strand:- start:486 stop:1703 length:1218 start_codon:yes stop_codon:yes gene_type:complete
MLINKQDGEGRSVVAFVLISIFLISFLGTSSSTNSDLEYQGSEPCLSIDKLSFNSTAANDSITWQTDLGPRLPGSNASAELRRSIVENLSEFTFEESSHDRENFTLTNLVGTFSPENSTGQNVVFVAHYDSRYIAERDDNESKRNLPIDGANDGASGVAVLIEVGKIIPNLDLNHDVTLFFTDAEDQGITGGFHPLTWSYGAYAWVENLTDDYKNNISAYIVIDMIGDAYLDFTKVKDTSSELWETITPIAAALGMMESELDCDGNYGNPIYNPNKTRGVIDDHVPANDAGIPAINFIDINYGENASIFGGHWHTHNDTADKVSAESLGYIGNLLELGLITSAWTLTPIELTEPDNESNQEENVLQTSDETDNAVEKNRFVGYVSIIIVSIILVLILMADISLKL